MNFGKIRDFCKKFRIAIGVITITLGIITGVYWWFLGAIPLIAGLTNFCPLCMITKKCDLPNNAQSENKA